MITSSDLRCIFTQMAEIQITNEGDCVRMSQGDGYICVPIADISAFADALTCWVRGGNTSLANQTDA